MGTLHIIAVALAAAPTIVHAKGCDEYPFAQGINVEDVDGGTRIIATAAVSVTFDDINSVKDARDEATLEAKGLISDFLSEGIKSEQVINKAVQETKSMQGDSKVAARNEVTERLKRLASFSQAMLRGVVPLGECYTKGQEFRASVGIKPETISAAENCNVSNSLANQPPGPRVGTSPPAPNAPTSTTQQPKGVDSYSDTQGLKKF